MSEPELYHRRAPHGFDTNGWIDAALRAGISFSIDDNGELMRVDAMPEIDPSPRLAWRALCRHMDLHGHEIRAEIGRRIEADGELQIYPDAESPTRRHVFRTIRGTPCLEN